MVKQPEPTSLFIFYVPKDEALLQELVVHLKVLERKELITLWDERQIPAGTDRIRTINIQLEHTSTILLLVSPDFLASDNHYKLALQHKDNKKVRVVPILLRPSQWKITPLSDLQVLPRSEKPVTNWERNDDAFTNIVQDLSDMIEKLRNSEETASIASSPPNIMHENATNTTRPLPQEHPLPSTHFVPSDKKPLTRRIVLWSLVFLILAFSAILMFRFAYPNFANNKPPTIHSAQTSTVITSSSHPSSVPTATRLPSSPVPNLTQLPTAAPISNPTQLPTPILKPTQLPTIAPALYTYSFPNGDQQGWQIYGPQIDPQPSITGTTGMSADGDGGSLRLSTHLFTDANQDTTGVYVSFSKTNLLGKTASCQVYVATPLPLTSNPGDNVYFRLLVESPATPANKEPTEYGDKYGPGGIQSGNWFTLSLTIKNPSGPDNDPAFQPDQVSFLEILLKVDVGQTSKINGNAFVFYIDNCKIA